MFWNSLGIAHIPANSLYIQTENFIARMTFLFEILKGIYCVLTIYFWCDPFPSVLIYILPVGIMQNLSVFPNESISCFFAALQLIQHPGAHIAIGPHQMSTIHSPELHTIFQSPVHLSVWGKILKTLFSKTKLHRRCIQNE
jgi:hypothetical protein